MYNNNGMYTNYEVESSKETFTETETSKKMSNMGANMGYATSSCCMSGGISATPLQGMVCPPVYECPQERIIHREIMHEVPQV